MSVYFVLSSRTAATMLLRTPSTCSAAASTSAGWMFLPPTMIKSSDRPNDVQLAIVDEAEIAGLMPSIGVSRLVIEVVGEQRVAGDVDGADILPRPCFDSHGNAFEGPATADQLGATGRYVDDVTLESVRID